jgi:DNA-binding IclR family transcriptional regulator
MGTVAKALSLMQLFNRTRRETGLSDLARLAGMNKATTLRLLRELESHGLMEQNAETRAYRLGPGLLRLAALREVTVPMRRIVEPFVDRLAAESGETTHLGLMQGDRLVAYAHAYSTAHATRVMMDDIDVLEFHATGSGLAVLAFSPPEFQNRVLGAPLKGFTPATMTDASVVRAAIANFRLTGVADSLGGVEEDVHSHAAPIFDTSRAPIGAITVAAPASRITPTRSAELAAMVRTAGAEITAAIGGEEPDGYPVGAAP